MRMRLLPALGLVVLLAGCVNTPPRSIELGQEFQLPLGHSAEWRDRFVVTFKQVLEDGRCPMNARCVWEGNAKIAVQVEEQGSLAVVELDTSDRHVRRQELRQAVLTLIHLEPTPMAGETAKGYVATLLLEARP